ncbi:MAG: response regulator [Desulfobacterales bacterium]|nr:response regulator [Desulfobacterales bacterium]
MVPLKLVIIEDEEAHFQLMKRAIEKAYPLASVDYFAKAEACLERLDEISPDVIITDYLMDGMNGIEFLESLNREKTDIPVIMITGQGDEKIAIRAMKLGAWDYLVKSGDFFTLLPGVIEKVVRERKLKASLQRSEKRFKEIFSQSPVGIGLYDPNGILVDANKSFLNIFSVSDLAHMKGIKLLDDPNMSPEVKARLLKGETARYEAPFDFDMVKKLKLYETARTGTACLDVVITPMGSGTDHSAGGYLIQIQDITERKVAEQEKKELQAHRMEIISTLASVIAHDFNNALSGITGNIELLKMNLTAKENISRHVEAMYNAAQRMAHLTNQLLAYTRGGKYWPKSISLSNFVEDSLPMIQHKIDPAIRVETDLAENILNIEADMTQMHMVLSAVLTNAAEAIEGTGCIKIVTSNEEIDEEFATHHLSLKPGPYACLTVQDDGKGMDDQTRRKVFEPFFSRKFHGRGLGMAAVYGIVKNHNGWISVDSKLGKGAVVRIYLPAVEARAKEAEKPKTELAKGTGTILVVEDDGGVMHVTRTILEKLGYDVLTAGTGMEAANIARTFDGDIDLAILDIGLPDVRGDTVYKLLMEARTNLKVIVCSGYAVDGPIQEILNSGAQGFIEKPFSFAGLSAEIKKVLENA